MTRLVRMSKKTNEAIDKLERENILKQANEAYALEKKNSREWQENQEELALWDVTLSDGLDDDHYHISKSGCARCKNNLIRR